MTAKLFVLIEDLYTYICIEKIIYVRYNAVFFKQIVIINVLIS